jgi:hypothetical protein
MEGNVSRLAALHPRSPFIRRCRNNSIHLFQNRVPDLPKTYSNHNAMVVIRINAHQNGQGTDIMLTVVEVGLISGFDGHVGVRSPLIYVEQRDPGKGKAHTELGNRSDHR